MEFLSYQVHDELKKGRLAGQLAIAQIEEDEIKKQRSNDQSMQQSGNKQII